MEMRDWQTLQKLIRLLKTLGSLTTATHHYIHANKCIGHFLLDQVYLMGKEILVITTMHQLQHLIATTLQRNMEMWHKSTALRAISYQIIITQIGLQAGYSITLNSIHLVECLHQIEKTLMSCPSEVTYVNTSYHYFLSSLACRPLGLFHQRGDTWITRVAPGKGNGAISTIIVAAILYLQKITGTASSRTRRLKRTNVLSLHTVMFVQSIHTTLLQSCFQSKLLRPGIAEVLYQMRFLVGTQHKVYTFYLAHILRFKLRIATCHNNKRSRILAHHTVYSLTTLMIGDFCYRASVN